MTHSYSSHEGFSRAFKEYFGMQQLADKMERMENMAFSAGDHKSVHVVMIQLSDSAFKMNVNAFNAAVETGNI